MTSYSFFSVVLQLNTWVPLTIGKGKMNQYFDTGDSPVSLDIFCADDKELR